MPMKEGVLRADIIIILSYYYNDNTFTACMISLLPKDFFIRTISYVSCSLCLNLQVNVNSPIPMTEEAVEVLTLYNNLFIMSR